MKRDNDFSLDNIPLTTKIVRRRKLEDEANSIFNALLKFYGTSHISSVNLIACTGTLCTIAKLRPPFLSDVVQALKNRQSNIPPTLSDSQLNSVRKHLKMQLLNILKQPAAYELQSLITHILSDLGSTNSEIAKAIPKLDKKEQARRNKRALENAAANAAKRIKIENVERPVRREMEIDQIEVDEQKLRSTKINESFILERLTSNQVVTELIVESLQNLPNEMPAHFLRNYVTEPNATLEQRSQRIAKQLAELMTAERLGPGAAEITKVPPMKPKGSVDDDRRGLATAQRNEPISAVEAMQVDDLPQGTGADADARREEATKKLRETMERAKTEPQTVGPRLKQKAKALKLDEITKPLAKAKKEQLLVQAVGRILNAEKKCVAAGMANRRKRFLSILAALFTADVRDAISKYIKTDFIGRFDLAELWLFEEYSLLQGFTRHSYVKSENKPDHAYNRLMSELVSAITEQTDDTFDHEKYLRRLFLSAPLITEDVFNLLVSTCEIAKLSKIAMEIIRDLAILRPPKRAKYINVLLRLSMHENAAIHDKAQQNLIVIYEQRQLARDMIEEYALRWLHYLEKETPPADIFSSEFGRTGAAIVWTEPLAKLCLSMFTLLLQYNDTLLSKLSDIYMKTTSEMKRTILRSIDVPIKKLGSENGEIAKLIETGAKGTETLITRIVYILTERTALDVNLVKRVRELYYTKVADVRLLIPIITGLTKQEVLTMLPKVLSLHPIVVKEVFNRLLGLGADFEHIVNFPLTPVELLVALHTLDTAKISLKFMVQATTMCLSEKERYTHEVMVNVLQQLVDVTPLPTLLMRTILQSHSSYPRLSAFIISLLNRMLHKQVWNQKVVWEGFLKCCQRLKPASFPVMVSLPPQQLRDALNTCPELRKPLLEHAKEVTEKQPAAVSKMVMDVLLGNAEDIFVTVSKHI